MTEVRTQTDKTGWDTFVREQNGHPLQLWGWGDAKAKHGWQAIRLAVGKGGAQLLIKQLPKPFGPLVYIPRGPFGNLLDSDEGRQALERYVRETYHPTLLVAEPDTRGTLDWPRWVKSKHHVLIARTAVLDLTKSEDELLSDMSKKTRQYIRKSAGEGILVRKAESKADVDDCLAIYRQTAQRAGFDLHDDDYYHDIFEQLGDSSPVYMAQHAGTTVAFLWPVVTPRLAFELYGGMNDEGQRLRANYHLKWSVIQDMKRQGITSYDVNGLLNDGVSAFKKGFIPDETMLSGTYDRPMSVLYPVWNTLLPLAKRSVRTLRRLTKGSRS